MAETVGAALETLLVQLDEKLATVWFSEAEIPTFQIVLKDQPAGTWTWTPSTGLTAGESRAPTCRVTLDTASLAEVIAGTTTCDDLLDQRRLEVSGYYGDWQAFVAAFTDEAGRASITADRARRPSTRAKELAIQRAEAVLREITTDESALVRVRKMLSMWRDHTIDRLIPNQTNLIPFPEVPLSAWGASDVARDIDAVVGENFDALQAECRQFITGEIHAPLYGHTQDKDAKPLFYNAPKGWRNFWVVNLYKKKPDSVLARLPVTSRVVDEITKKHTLVHVAYLMMEPGAHLKSHTDGASLFFHSYYGMIVPKGCYFETQGDRIPLEERKSLVFSDSFVHSAGNAGDSMRVVFALLYPHPQLTEIERTCVRRLQEVLPKGTLIFSGEYA